MLQKILQLKLKILSKLILAKYNPEIIGITGSVGKTSTRDAIEVVLASKLNVRKSIKNYNNEIGVPLTITGTEKTGSFIFGWTKVIFKAFKLLLIKDANYPKILILEMGIDKPGDMSYLLSIVKPKIGVVTNISESHLALLKTINNIAKEKGKLIKALPQFGQAILNYDDKKVLEIKKINKKVKVFTYGLNTKANIHATNISLNYDKKGCLNGINFTLVYKKQKQKVTILGAVGDPVVQAALAGAAAGIIYGLGIKEIGKALSSFKTTKPGRACLIKGIKNTLIIDDVYNSSPESSIAAINILNKVKVKKGAKIWAVLGDMLELGAYTETGHKKVGEKIAISKIDKLILVGKRSRIIAKAAQKKGEENIFHFSSNERAGHFLQERIKKNDIILVKASRDMKMEEIMEEIRSI